MTSMYNQDRLSILPEQLLFIIISHLQFKEAVKTSILSPSWRFISLGTRNMEFDERDFVTKSPDSQETRQNQRRDFVDFVIRWIGNYRGSDCASKFLLAFSHPEDHLLQMKQCISFAIDHKVKVLDLDFSDPTWDEEKTESHRTFLQLPMINDEQLGRLESLKLFACNLPAIPQESQNFSALKIVYLGWVTLKSADIKALLEKCPALEYFGTKKCCYIGYFEVIAPRLKTLVLDKCYPPEVDMMLEFVFNTPNLNFFKYSGVLASFEFERLNSLEEANLDFGLQMEYGEYGDILYRCLVEIACVKTLTLCTYMLQVIPSGEEPLQLKPSLASVKHLILKTSLDRNEFYGISFILNSCPNMEVLTFDLNTPARIFPEYDPPFRIEEHEFLNYSPYTRISCVKKKLKAVVVKGFKGEENQLLVLRYLLKFGRVLDSIYIHISEEPATDGTSMETTYSEKAHSLVQFQIASKRLQVFLSSA